MKDLREVTLETGEFVNLRRTRPDDAERTFLWRQADPATFLRKGTQSVEEQRAWLSRLPEDEINFIIETRQGVPLGTLALVAIDMQNLRAEPRRFLIGEKQLARGLPVAAEAVLLLYELAFEKLGLRRVSGTMAGNNPRMYNWHKHIGMVEEGRLRQHYFVEGKAFDAIYFGLLREEFRANTRPRLQRLVAMARRNQ